jgi:RNase P/RNase MRP subunit p29
VIDTPRGIRRIPKMHSIFVMHLPGREHVEIDGSVMVLAPERRINLHEKKRIP